MEISGEMLSAVVPIIVHWVFAGIYGLLGYLENYRLHPKGAEEEKNIVSKSTVFRTVLVYHTVQMIAVFSLAKFSGGNGAGPKPEPPFPVVALQFFAGMVVVDTWQYFVHRYMHKNKFLYKHFHSWHHRVVVPYSYSTMYSNPIEGFFIDTGSGVLAVLFTGMTPKTMMYFFSFATIKTLDDHSNLYLPWNPLQLLFRNNVAFHDIHHQLRGNKYNYSQPFFIAWDKILGTYMPFTVEKRKGGGFEARPIKDDSD